MKFENARHFYIRIPEAEFENKPLPAVFTNIIRKKNYVECQTLELMKRNQKVVLTIQQITSLTRTQITISHQEVVLMSTSPFATDMSQTNQCRRPSCTGTHPGGAGTYVNSVQGLRGHCNARHGIIVHSNFSGIARLNPTALCVRPTCHHS